MSISHTKQDCYHAQWIVKTQLSRNTAKERVSYLTLCGPNVWLTFGVCNACASKMAIIITENL